MCAFVKMYNGKKHCLNQTLIIVSILATRGE